MEYIFHINYIYIFFWELWIGYTLEIGTSYINYLVPNNVVICLTGKVIKLESLTANSWKYRFVRARRYMSTRMSWVWCWEYLFVNLLFWFIYNFAMINVTMVHFILFFPFFYCRFFAITPFFLIVLPFIEFLGELISSLYRYWRPYLRLCCLKIVATSGV